MKTIIVPLDGSLLAEQALPHARMLATTLEAHVLLLRAVPPIAHEIYLAEEMFASERYDVGRGYQRQHDPIQHQTEEAEHYLGVQAALLHSKGIDVATSTQIGQPAEVIAEMAQTSDAMIVMATHGLSGIRRWALGSVTDKVIHVAHAPVYVVRTNDRTQPPVELPRKILVPLDGSELARRALPLAVDLAIRAQAELILLTVVVPTGLDYGYGMMATPPNDAPLLREYLAEELGQLAEKLEAQHIQTKKVVADGFAADAIISEAARLHADLIVMSSHGRGGIGRWVLGSVADKVLHSAAQPLVLVRSGNQN